MDIVTATADAVDASLATKIKDALARQAAGAELIAEGRRLWVASTLDLARYLTEARDRFPSNNEFGDWLVAEGIDIPKNDRSALIAFGRDPQRAETVLLASEKTSLRRIADCEFRVRPARSRLPMGGTTTSSHEPSSHTAEPSSHTLKSDARERIPLHDIIALADELLKAARTDVGMALALGYAANQNGRPEGEEDDEDDFVAADAIFKAAKSMAEVMKLFGEGGTYALVSEAVAVADADGVDIMDVVLPNCQDDEAA